MFLCCYSVDERFIAVFAKRTIAEGKAAGKKDYKIFAKEHVVGRRERRISAEVYEEMEKDDKTCVKDCCISTKDSAMRLVGF